VSTNLFDNCARLLYMVDMSKTIGTTMSDARKRLGLREVDVASKAGVSEATVKRIESGRAWSRRTLEAVAKVLGLKVRVGA
jgi:transcriptional regulator with XRE-family HTH domain